MPKGKTELKRPIGADGKPMITVDELANRSGLSKWHIRERTRPNPRGKFIPSHKIGPRIWFEEIDAMAAIYESRKRVEVVAPKLDISYI